MFYNLCKEGRKERRKEGKKEAVCEIVKWSTRLLGLLSHDDETAHHHCHHDHYILEQNSIFIYLRRCDRHLAEYETVTDMSVSVSNLEYP